MALNWPWRGRAANENPHLQHKSAQGFVALQFDREARWSQSGYVGLSRQGFMRNPDRLPLCSPPGGSGRRDALAAL